MAELSQQGKVRSGMLQDGIPALFVTGVEESAWTVTDILAVRNGELANIVLSDVTGVSAEIAPFCALYPDGHQQRRHHGGAAHPESIPSWGNEGEADLPPRSTGMPMTSDGTTDAGPAAPITTWRTAGTCACRTDWRDQILITRTTGDRGGRRHLLHPGAATRSASRTFLRIIALTGSNREVQATRGGRFILSRQSEIIYTAELLDANSSWEYGLTEDEVREAFSLITTEWTAGDKLTEKKGRRAP